MHSSSSSRPHLIVGLLWQTQFASRQFCYGPYLVVPMALMSRFIIIIIRQPLCPVVGRRPQHAVSKLPCLVLSSAISCRSSICLGRLFTAWLSPLLYFLVIWSPSGDTRDPSVVFEAVDMPCQGPFHFSYSVDYIYDFCPLPDPDVGHSIFVCDVEHTSFHFGLCGFSVYLRALVFPV